MHKPENLRDVLRKLKESIEAFKHEEHERAIQTIRQALREFNSSVESILERMQKSLH